MAQPPPGPPGAPPAGGGQAGPPGTPLVPDPYAADRALGEWAAARGHALGTNPDLAWYRGWYPCVYLFPIARVGRELRASLGDASACIAEAFEADALKQATNDDRHVCSFVLSGRLTRRVAIRSKLGGGVLNELKSGIGSLFSNKSAGSVLGDPTFETHFDITTPTRDEGNAALPIALRQYLLQAQWRGILETRAGGLVFVTYGCRTFDVATLDWTLGTLGTLLGSLGA